MARTAQSINHSDWMAELAKEQPAKAIEWTEEHDAFIRDARMRGYSYGQIGRVLGRKASTVQKHASERLGL